MDENNENIKDVDSTPAVDNDAVEKEVDAKARELMELIADPGVMRAYRASRSGVRKPVSKSEKKKKKAKRRMVKKSKR